MTWPLDVMRMSSSVRILPFLLLRDGREERAYVAAGKRSRARPYRGGKSKLRVMLKPKWMFLSVTPPTTIGFPFRSTPGVAP